MQTLLQRNSVMVFLFLFVIVAKSEERLSWTTKDQDIRRSLFVPYNLPEGKEENRVLPWVFHEANDTKLMQIRCMMRGFNASNNTRDYMDARWSHPGFDDSQVDTSAPVEMGEEDGVPYAIWTMEITISAEDAGKKWATCEWQQGDFPLSTDLKFLILSLQKSESGADTVVLSYDLGEQLDEKDLTKQIEDDIKRQISEKYSMPPSSVSRTEGGQKFLITVKKEQASEFYDGNSVPNNQDSPDSVNDVGDDENSKTKSNSGDGWSTGEIVVISLLVTTGVVASLILLLFFIRPAFLVFVIYINSSLLRL